MNDAVAPFSSLRPAFVLCVKPCSSVRVGVAGSAVGQTLAFLLFGIDNRPMSLMFDAIGRGLCLGLLMTGGASSVSSCGCIRLVPRRSAGACHEPSERAGNLERRRHAAGACVRYRHAGEFRACRRWVRAREQLRLRDRARGTARSAESGNASSYQDALAGAYYDGVYVLQSGTDAAAWYWRCPSRALPRLGMAPPTSK